MSLAEELLADLEDGDDDEELEDMVEQATAAHVENVATPMDIDNFNFPVPASAAYKHKPKPREPLVTDEKLVSVRQLCHLRDSEALARVMSAIETNEVKPSPAWAPGPAETNPEYQLIVEANSLAVDIDGEVGTIHKFTRDKYGKRFPELESLITSPLEYLRTVKELGNELDRAKNNPALPGFLTQATIMVVSVTASTTQGQVLTPVELDKVFEACDMALELNEFKLKIFSFVESKMTFIAPNMTTIVGSATAAKLMGIAGGLTKLSKMPACNFAVLGQQKKTLSGFSQVAALPHTGFIYYCELVQDTPPDLRRKAARLVAAKCCLAARVDAGHSSPNGDIGQKLREEIEKKLDKLQEPPPVKLVKPLPKPVDPPKKRRGGKRVRKMKERSAVTELRKQANRTTFGDIGEDAYQGDLGYNRGQMGKSGTGKIRQAQIDEKTKVRISKTLQKSLQKQQVYGGSTTIKKQISGTASSVAFTPLQGLEIVNPSAAEKKVNEANAKYFSNTGSFINVTKN